MMILKYFNPVTAGTRHRVDKISAEVTYRGRSMKGLSEGIKRAFGVDNNGRRTCRSKRSGRKILFRTIDFKRNKFDIGGTVVRIEYDPNRSANIALIKYPDGDYRYILAPKDLNVGQNIISSEKAMITVGNAMPLKSIPVGNLVHNIELNIGEGAKLVRSAGLSAKVLSFDGNFCTLKMPSREHRKIHASCRAVIGVVGNAEHNKGVLGKAGRSFHKGKRPIVRGSAMNPVDHPHGGGEGRTSIGRIPITRNGIKRGTLTRSKRKFTNRFIVKVGRLAKK